MLAEIRAALAVQLRTGLPALTVHAEAPGAINPPAAVIVPDQPAITYNTGMGGRSDYNLIIAVLVATADTELSQTLIDPYLHPQTGVPGVVVGSLGGLVSYCRVITTRNYGEVTYAGSTYLGADFQVRLTV